MIGIGIGIGAGIGVSPPYAGHNAVTFDGASDYLYRLNNLLDGLSDGTSVTVAFKAFLPTNGTVFSSGMGSADGGIFTITAAGNLLVNVASASGLQTSLVAGKTGVERTVHYIFDSAANIRKLWVDGVLSYSSTAAGTAHWTNRNDYVIGAALGGTDASPTITTNFWNGTISFLYVLYNTAITDPARFYSDGDVDVFGINPTPHIGFGGRQVAADWNAGTNLGSGGAFTMNGGV